MAQLNLRDAWSSWNAHHLRVRKSHPHLFRGPRAAARFRKQIAADWKRIVVLHPQDHRARKIQFRIASRRANALKTETEDRRANVLELSDENSQGLVDDDPRMYELLLMAEVQLLAAMKDVVDVESRRIGEPADLIRAYDTPNLVTQKNTIAATGQRLATSRQIQEIDTDGMNERRKQYQKRSELVAQPGGRMWYGHIDSNPNTSIGIWLEGDVHNNIINRVAVKDTWYTSNIAAWTSPGWWIGNDPLDPNIEQPAEVVIMDKLTSTGNENVLHMRSWYMRPERLMFRIYMEFCPHGDVADLVFWTDNRCFDRPQIPHRYIPEPAVWYLFQCLIHAGLVMDQGGVSHPAPVWNGNSVVHLDLKPANVFIGDYAAGRGNFDMYPTFKLADFGHAVDDRRDPNGAYRGRGTEGFLAPEQMENYHGRSQPDLNTKTNVWGIGMTIMQAMNLENDPADMFFEVPDGDEADTSLVPQFTPAAEESYSPQLRELVYSCVQYQQQNRPTFQHLLTAVRNLTGYRGVAPSQLDLANRARSGTLNAIPNGLALLHGLKRDKYAIGLAMSA